MLLLLCFFMTPLPLQSALEDRLVERGVLIFILACGGVRSSAHARGIFTVILTTSCSGSKGEAGLSVYAAAKAALRSLARSLSAELMPTKGIRVNTVSPGMTATRIHAETDKESVSA